jgi:FixJ family two-component response regulator
LLGAIRHGLEADENRREEQAVVSELMNRYEKLTAREREVLELVTTGLMNKEIAAKLGLSEITVKIHRRQVMTKMEATSLADLVRMADRVKRRSRS